MPREDQSGKLLILSVDTSQKNGTVCLARGNSSAFEVLGTSAVDGGMFSAQLVPVIAKLLAESGVNKDELQGIAAAVGPGSFTGLRIGLAAVKGFAEVLNIPIAAVSTLEMVAASAQEQKVLAVMDAGRKEFYVGLYSGGELVREFLATLNELAAEIKRNHDALVVSPEHSVKEITEANGGTLRAVSYPGAETVARLGLKKFVRGLACETDALDANYLRRDEGLFSAKK